MSDFGAVYDYALQLEAQLPPEELLKMQKEGRRPGMMPQLVDPNADKPAAETAPTTMSAPKSDPPKR